MVHCIQTHKLTLPRQECDSYRKIIKLSSALYNKPQKSIRLFFIHPSLAETQIQSQDDLMALKYLIREGCITFKVLISKSKEEIQEEMISETVDDYLSFTYEDIAEAEFQKEIGKSIQSFLSQLYKKVARKQAKEKVKKIERQEVDDYLNDMNNQIARKESVIRNIPSRVRKNRAVRVSPEKELFRRKQSQIEGMVSRILESMMPVMVKELSYRIVQQLTCSKEASLYDKELNPEQL